MAQRKRKNRKQERTGASTRAAGLLERAREADDPAARQRALDRLRRIRQKKGRALQGDLRSQIRDELRTRRAEQGDDATTRQRARKARRQAQRQAVTPRPGPAQTTRDKQVSRIRSQARRLLRRFEQAPRKKRKTIARKLQQLVAQYGSVLDEGLVQQIRSAIESVRPAPVDSTTPDAGTELVDELDLYDDGSAYPDDPSFDFGIDFPGLDPTLQDLLERATDLEQLLQLDKKGGKKKFKQIWKKVKIQFGDNLTAKGRSSIATEGSQAASLGNRGRFVGPDSLASFGRSRLVGPDSLASFGRSKFVGPDAMAEFGKGGLKLRPAGGESFEDLLPFLDELEGSALPDELLYDDLVPIDEAPDAWATYDPYADPFADSYPTSFTELVDPLELFYDEQPIGYSQVDDSGWEVPEYEIRDLDRFASVLDRPGDSFDSMDWFVPTDPADMWQAGGTWEYTEYDPPTDEDLLLESYAPRLYADELDADSTVVGPSFLDDDDAWEGLDLLEDQLAGLETMLQTRLVPAVRSMSQSARQTRDPVLMRRSRAARAALAGAMRDYRRGLSDCQALRAQNDLGFVGRLIGPAVRLAGKWVLGATAGVVGTLAATGGAGIYTAGKKVGESVGTGMRWGLSIGLPVALTVLVADRVGLLGRR